MNTHIEVKKGQKPVHRKTSRLQKVTQLAAGLTAMLVTTTVSAQTIPLAEEVLKECVLVSALTPVSSTKTWVLDLSGIAYTDDALFHLWEYTGADNQEFVLNYQGGTVNGHTEYTMGIQHSGKCMYTYSDSNNANVFQKTCSTNMPWHLDAQSDGTYVVRSGFDNKYVLDVHGTPKNGSRVSLWTYHGGTNQKWKILNCRNMWNNGISPRG